jgi:hypothetical protein
MQASWKQTTLDNWLCENKEVSEKQQTPDNKAKVEVVRIKEEAQVRLAKPIVKNANTAKEFRRENKAYIEVFLDDWDDTICNTELDMRHDKNGNVLGWMESEPKADEWDGSVDNKIKNLEDYVSKRGWLF